MMNRALQNWPEYDTVIYMENFIYTLKFIPKFGLWELKISPFRIRFYATRYGAEKLIARYRKMLRVGRGY